MIVTKTFDPQTIHVDVLNHTKDLFFSQESFPELNYRSCSYYWLNDLLNNVHCFEKYFFTPRGIILYSFLQDSMKDVSSMTPPFPDDLPRLWETCLKTLSLYNVSEEEMGEIVHHYHEFEDATLQLSWQGFSWEFLEAEEQRMQ